ncbi:hypothetical protein EBZ37_12255 [bacterium]|nr:hypothetical protein [bacterium]
MEPLRLQSEEEFYTYLKKFLKSKPKAVQLDGSNTKKENRKILLVFTWSVNGQDYKISGDFSKKAAKEFVSLAEEHGSAAIVLKEYLLAGQPCGLILATHNKPDGFHCFPYVSKAKDELKRVA